MVWIIIAGFLGFAVVAWARSSKKRFDAAEAGRRAGQRERMLDQEEAALLARLKDREQG